MVSRSAATIQFPARDLRRPGDRYIASTTLTEVSNGKVYWSARTRSDAPGRIEAEVDDFVSVMMDALSNNGLL